jgi:hypothetical protein
LHCTSQRICPSPAIITAKTFVPCPWPVPFIHACIIETAWKPSKRIHATVVLKCITNRICDVISLVTTRTFIATIGNLTSIVAIVATRATRRQLILQPNSKLPVIPGRRIWVVCIWIDIKRAARIAFYIKPTSRINVAQSSVPNKPILVCSC